MSDKKVQVIISAKNALKGGLQSSTKSLRRFESGYGRSLKKVEKENSKTVEKVKKSWLSLNTVFAGIAAIGFGKLLAGSVGSASKTVLAPVIEMENFKTQFSVLLGNIDMAEDRIRELNNFAAKTPFQIEGVMGASRQLEVMTKGALSTGKGLTMVGDIAAGTAKSSEELSWQFKNVSLWVGRLYDGLKSGRPVGEAMMRLQEMGAVSGDVRNKIESLAKEGYSFTDVWGEFEKGTSRFNGLMEKQSKTLGGIFSNLQDVITITLAELGQEMGEELKPAIDEVVKEIEKLSKDGSIKEWGHEAAEVLKDVISVLKSTVSFFSQHGDKLVLGAKIFLGIKALKLALGLTKKLGGGIAGTFQNASKFINNMQVDELNKKFSSLSVKHLQEQLAGVKREIMEINAIQGNDNQAKSNSKFLTEKRDSEEKAIKDKEKRERALLKEAESQIKTEEASAKRKLKAEEALKNKAHRLAEKEIKERERLLDKQNKLLQKAKRNAAARLKQEKAAAKQKEAADGQNRAADKQLKAAGKKPGSSAAGVMSDKHRLKQLEKEEYGKLLKDNNKSQVKDLSSQIKTLADKKHKELLLEKERVEKEVAANKELYDRKVRARAAQIREEASMEKKEAAKYKKVHPSGDISRGQKRRIAKSFNDSFEQEGVTRYKSIDEFGNTMTRQIKHSHELRKKTEQKQSTFLSRLNRKRERWAKNISNSSGKFSSKLDSMGSQYDKLSNKMSQFAGVVALGIGAFSGGWAIGRGIAKLTGSDKGVEHIYNLVSGGPEETYSGSLSSDPDESKREMFAKAQENVRRIEAKKKLEAIRKESSERRRVTTDEYLYNQRFAERDIEISKKERSGRRDAKVDRDLESKGYKHIGRDIKLKHQLQKINEKIYDEEKKNQKGAANDYLLKRLEIQKASLESQIKYKGAIREVQPDLVKELYNAYEQVKVLRAKRKEVGMIKKIYDAGMAKGFEDSVDALSEIQHQLEASKDTSNFISRTWQNQIKIQELQLAKENEKLKVKVQVTDYESLVSKELESQSLQLDYQLKKQQARKMNASEILAISEKQLQVQMNQKKEQIAILKQQIKSGGLYKQIALSNKETKIRARAEAEINLKLKEQALISGKALSEERTRVDLSKREEMVQDRILSRLEAQGFMTDRLVAKNKELAAARKESLKALEEEADRLRFMDKAGFNQNQRGQKDEAKAKAKFERGLARDIQRGGFGLDENGELKGKKGFSRLRQEQIKNYLQRQQITREEQAHVEQGRISGMIDQGGFYLKDGRLRSDRDIGASHDDQQKIKQTLKERAEKVLEEKRLFAEQEEKDRAHRAHQAKVFHDKDPKFNARSRVNKAMEEANKAVKKTMEKEALKKDPAEIAYQSMELLKGIKDNTEGSIGV